MNVSFSDTVASVDYTDAHCSYFACFLTFCRTARADNKGTALTFVSHSELLLLEEVESALTGGNSRDKTRNIHDEF